MDAEVRNLIDTLARHAAASSMGAESFVDFVRSNQKGNPLFAFLFDPAHPHHADWLHALSQEQAKQVSVGEEVSTEGPTVIPVRLIPAIVEDTLRWSDPYTPADAISIKMASSSSRRVEMDEYLSLRWKCFEDDLAFCEGRPGVSYSDACAEMGVPVSRGGKESDATPVVHVGRASDAGFRGGKVKGLGFDRSKAGQTEAALEGYRSMKKLGQRYGHLKK